MKLIYRPIVTLMICLLCSVSMFAEDSLPVIEVTADRTVIYPQRMELTGEESLMDLLQMVPDLMIGGYDEVISSYNLRIDNTPINGDVRLILSQMKAKDIAKIQVCDNTGVAKGTVGMGSVLDINMLMPGGVKGFVEGQGGFGKEIEGSGTVNVLYGGPKTDLYANASYRYRNGHNEYLSLHMTNRFDNRNKLLTYLTQQYVGLPDAPTHKVMGRARYFHTFNDLGTELLIVGGYQYSRDPLYSNQLPLFVVELNTPMPLKGLTMMAGVEGDYLMTRLNDTQRSWDVFNHDIYLQFSYSLPHWRFTAGNRVMFYHYKMTDAVIKQQYTDIRNNTSAGIICQPSNRHQIQLGYYRKFFNPSYLILFTETNSFINDVWVQTQDLLEERDINQFKLAYAYSRQKLTVQTAASFYLVEGSENYGELNASAYWKTQWVTLCGGAKLYVAQNNVFASVHLAPTAYLPRQWQIGLQLIYFTPKSPVRDVFGTPVYACLSVNKQIGIRWNLGVEWHDMFDSFCPEAKVNRHAAHIKAQFRF